MLKYTLLPHNEVAVMACINIYKYLPSTSLAKHKYIHVLTIVIFWSRHKISRAIHMHDTFIGIPRISFFLLSTASLNVKKRYFLMEVSLKNDFFKVSYL